MSEKKSQLNTPETQANPQPAPQPTAPQPEQMPKRIHWWNIAFSDLKYIKHPVSYYNDKIQYYSQIKDGIPKDGMTPKSLLVGLGKIGLKIGAGIALVGTAVKGLSSITNKNNEDPALTSNNNDNVIESNDSIIE